jgi:hypothetical protein
MSQYPVENEAGVYEAINYLLSGPAGLGQNFEGFATFVPAYITGTFRAPFTVPITTSPPPTWYVAPISISDIQPVDPDPITGETPTIEVTFASAQASPPFLLGDTVVIADVTDDGSGEIYDGRYARSVVYCDTTKVVIQYFDSVWSTYISGGDISKNNSNTNSSTDCNARVTVYGPTDQVFVSAQLNLDVAYTCSEASEFQVAVRINRYQGFIDTTDLNTPIANRDYLFDFDETVSQKVYSFSVSTSGTESLEAIFTTVLDRPSFGYYWYILEVDFITKTNDDPPVPLPGDAQPDVLEVGLRSLTAQVIKQ